MLIQSATEDCLNLLYRYNNLIKKPVLIHQFSILSLLNSDTSFLQHDQTLTTFTLGYLTSGKRYWSQRDRV